jgi:hypothetical protein
VQQVGPKASGCQNFGFLALQEKAVCVTQILCTTAATARERRFFFIGQIMLFFHKKSKKMKISDFFFIFLDTKPYSINHKPYVASKKSKSEYVV